MIAITYEELMKLERKGEQPYEIEFHEHEWEWNKEVKDYVMTDYPNLHLAKTVDRSMTMFGISFLKLFKCTLRPLDKLEKKYLRSVLVPYRKRVETIAKFNRGGGREYLRVILDEDNIMELPTFPEGSMYVGMELKKDYSLYELGLFRD